MAFVSVPKDLTKVKNKIIFNLTKRQLICFGIAATAYLPWYCSGSRASVLFLKQGNHWFQ